MKEEKKGINPRQALLILFILAFAVFSILSIGTVVLPDFSCGPLEQGNYYIWIPKNVSDNFYGAKVNLHFLMPYGNTMDVHGVVSERKISPMRCGEPEEHDYSVSMTWREALALTGSSQPIRDFVSMWDNGKIIVSPKGVDNMDRLQTAKMVLLNYDNEPVPEEIKKQFDKYRANATG